MGKVLTDLKVKILDVHMKGNVSTNKHFIFIKQRLPETMTTVHYQLPIFENYYVLQELQYGDYRYLCLNLGDHVDQKRGVNKS